MTNGERAAVLGAAVFLATLVGALNLGQARWGLALVFFAFLAYLIVLLLPIARYRSEWGWFHPLVFMPLWALITGLPSIPVFVSGLQRHSALPGRTVEELNGLVVQGLLLAALGWLMFYAGYAFVGRKRTATLAFSKPRAIFPKMLLVAGISGLAFMILLRVAGGLNQLLLQRGIIASQRIGEQIGGHWHVLVGVLVTACLVWLALRPTIIRKPVFWLIFASGLFMDFAATGSRSGVIIPVVMATVIWSLRAARVPYMRALTLGAVALVMLGALGQFRAETMRVDRLEDVRLDIGVQSTFARGLEDRMNSGEENAALYAILGRVPDEVDFLWGRSYLSIPAAPIPSAIWEAKPDAGGSLVGHLIFRRPEGAGGVPAGSVGEAFWNFHIPGVIAVFFLWGMFANWLARFYRAARGHAPVVALYVLTLFGFAPNSDAFYGWFQGIVPAVVMLVLFCGWPRIQRARAAAPWAEDASWSPIPESTSSR